MKIKGFIGTSLLDYPKKICSIIFLGGCDFRCPYCQNPDLISNFDNFPTIPLSEILKDLESRQNFIEGVVISGGEPTIHKNIHELIIPIKKMGLAVKLDTNGNNPDVIENLFEKKLIDYVAMDIKTSFERYNEAAGCNVSVDKIKKSVELIKNFAPDYEFRTTVAPSIVSENDILSISKSLRGAKAYYLHQFRSIITFDKEYQNEIPYNPEILYKFKEILLQNILKVEIRGL